MSANKENNLVQAYVELNKFCQNGDYERALKAAGKVLQISPNEQKAFHCKVICFIQLHNFKEALSVLCNSKNAALAADLHFEKAYSQYRLNCPKDALETVDNAPELTPALKELRAQILYRLEQYQDCYNLYRDIVKNTTDDYEDERKANMSAVVANLAALNPSADLPSFEESTYELSYNSGTTLAMRGKYNEALQVLKKAEQTCSESVIEDGGTEEEAKEEAAIIRVQQAYCQQQMGKEKEAATIYHNVLKDKPSDQALIAIASNNLVVINRDTNVFDSRKRMKAATQDGLEHKLNSRQRATIAYNQAILAIYSNQPDFCKQCCVKLSREFNQDRKAALVEASSLVKEGKRSQAVTLLLKHGGPLVLAAAQVLLAQGDRKAVIKLLEESEYKYKPGVVGLLCTLLTADNEYEKASKLFTDVYEYYKDNDEMVAALRAVWRAAGEALRALCERLRLVLEPTGRARRAGDFRTGRAINMRRVIPYIASHFRKDRIWLRRTKPAKREYKIAIAIDDSSSMADNRSKELAFESLALVSQALNLLESGDLAVLSFGEKPNLLHPFTEQFSEHSGAKILEQLRFEQTKTKIAQLLDFCTVMFDQQSIRSDALNAKLLVIVSDGRGIFSEGETRVLQSVRRARQQGIFLVYVIIDNPDNKDSIMDIRRPVMDPVTNSLSGFVPYLDTFPFPFYLILRDMNALPTVLGDALRQWFELAANTAS